MASHINSYDPNAMFMELEKAGEERAEAEYQAHILERNGEILLAELQVRFKRAGEPIGICKEFARSTDEWKTHVAGEAVAIRNRSKARAHWEAVRMLAEARKTQEVSLRTLTR